jgi:tetratricopeptide (TPR) repeat protein
MSQVKRKVSRKYWFALVIIGLVLVGGFLFRSHIARAMVTGGNQFFGGSMPYNLAVADGFYRAALILDPHVPDAWHQRARIAFLGGDFATAKKYIDTQLALHGDSLMPSYYVRGLIEGYARDFGPAEKDYLTYLKWDRYNWAANNDLAWVYFSEGKFKEAALRLQGFVDTGPKNPWLLTMHAMAVYNLGDNATAHKELLEARSALLGLTESDWIRSYPGNDPAIASAGLASFRKTIEDNIALVENGTQIK